MKKILNRQLHDPVTGSDMSYAPPGSTVTEKLTTKVALEIFLVKCFDVYGSLGLQDSVLALKLLSDLRASDADEIVLDEKPLKWLYQTFQACGTKVFGVYASVISNAIQTLVVPEHVKPEKPPVTGISNIQRKRNAAEAHRQAAAAASAHGPVAGINAPGGRHGAAE